jgi:hypothetical protein
VCVCVCVCVYVHICLRKVVRIEKLHTILSAAATDSWRVR